MLVFNFVPVMITAFIAEVLRVNFFPFSGVYSEVEFVTDQIEEKKKESTELTEEDLLANASDNLKKVYQEYKDHQKVIEDVKKQKVECEQYNNQDHYVKFAKMQRSITRSEKLIKTSTCCQTFN